ncbi:aspartate/glutamate racemase family protein [Bacillus benzoevorans]|uniref:Aspartate racemase n=1 Tax=Bacillus benzoevorans TaxID=1456 RepID=A0A7X0HNS9_9BACI|nr:amino acid racemase [Bacillus benzoevorans]MBB6444093.1 aspartate racemase [Bacillus benzoevorans]
MKKVGIIGGIGPESTVDYYQSIIAKVQERVGSKEVLPELFINSINMYKLFQLLTNGQIKELIDYLADAVQELKNAGADFVVMSGNTPHIVFGEVQQKVQIPMISIVEETLLNVKMGGLQKIGLIGTKFTMENDFFKIPFAAENRKIIVPNEAEQKFIHKKIVEELENGLVNKETKEQFLEIIEQMVKRDGVHGIILGCTELPMLLQKEDLAMPVFNTTEIHVEKIVTTILAE